MSYEAHLRAELARLEQQAQAQPLPIFKPTVFETPGQPNIQELVKLEVERQLKSVQPVEPQQADVMKTAMFQLLTVSLKPAEMEWVNDHIKKGAPGFAEFLNSEGVRTIAQMAFETYKEFLQK